MKKNNKKGFTLAELLIVVAIIAVLVAISIPVFTGQLEKAKIATDKANVRSWYAEQVAGYLSDPENFEAATEYTGPALKAKTPSVTVNGTPGDADYSVVYSNDAGDGMTLPTPSGS